MSEESDMRSMGEDIEALNDAERWTQEITDAIVNTRVLKGGNSIRPDMAYDGARWAVLWREDFNMLMEMGAEAYPQAETVTLMMAARYISVKRFDSSEFMYSPDTPSLQTTVAAYDAFCLSFGDQMPWASEVLGWNMEAYDPAAKHECRQKDTLQSLAGEMLA